MLQSTHNARFHLIKHVCRSDTEGTGTLKILTYQTTNKLETCQGSFVAISSQNNWTEVLLKGKEEGLHGAINSKPIKRPPYCSFLEIYHKAFRCQVIESQIVALSR